MDSFPLKDAFLLQYTFYIIQSSCNLHLTPVFPSILTLCKARTAQQQSVSRNYSFGNILHFSDTKHPAAQKTAVEGFQLFLQGLIQKANQEKTQPRNSKVIIFDSRFAIGRKTSGDCVSIFFILPEEDEYVFFFYFNFMMSLLLTFITKRGLN